MMGKIPVYSKNFKFLGAMKPIPDHPSGHMRFSCHSSGAVDYYCLDSVAPQFTVIKEQTWFKQSLTFKHAGVGMTKEYAVPVYILVEGDEKTLRDYLGYLASIEI